MDPDTDRAGRIIRGMKNPHSSVGNGRDPLVRRWLSARGDHLGHKLQEPGRPKGLKPVSYAENCLDIAAAVLAEFLAQPADMNVERTGADLVAVAPYAQQEGVASDYFTCVLYQQRQQVILFAG